jgi:protein SCO1/2
MKSILLTLAIALVCLIPAADLVTAQNRKKATQKAATRYACPMHPDITSTRPAKCPKCGMTLTKPAAAAPEERSDSSALSSPRIPDLAVKDQDGNSLNFYRDLVKDRVVAINFVFTTCTAICPSLTATFRRLQQELEKQSLPVTLISISVDPATDTPERLHDFATRYKAGPGWTFVTGETANIDQLLREFGVAVADRNDHTPMILIGNDEAGYWTRAYGLTAPSELVKLLADAASRK